MPTRPRERISPSSSQNSKKITEMGLLSQSKVQGGGKRVLVFDGMNLIYFV